MMRIAVVMIVGLAGCGPAAKGDPGDKGDTGPAGAQGSAGPTGTTGQDILEGIGNGQLAVTPATNFTTIPGLAVSVTLPANAKLLLETNGGVQCAATGTAFAAVDIAIFVDGSITNAQRRVVAANTTAVAQMIANWSFGRTLLLPSGPHTIEVRAAGADPNSATANVSSAAAPQLQGALTATILRQ